MFTCISQRQGWASSVPNANSAIREHHSKFPVASVLVDAVQVLFDLLSASPGTPDDLTIVDEAGVTAVKGLTHIEVHNEADALALLFEGNSVTHVLHPCIVAIVS